MATSPRGQWVKQMQSNPIQTKPKQDRAHNVYIVGLIFGPFSGSLEAACLVIPVAQSYYGQKEPDPGAGIIL